MFRMYPTFFSVALVFTLSTFDKLRQIDMQRLALWIIKSREKFREVSQQESEQRHWGWISRSQNVENAFFQEVPHLNLQFT